MKFDLNPFGKGRLSRRLLGAFFLIVAVLAVAGMMVTAQITARSLEARAESQLANDEAIVNLNFGEIEEKVTFYSELLARAEMLTERLDQPTVTRSLTISLLSSVRRDKMRVHVYGEEPANLEFGPDLIQKGFLGMRATSFAKSRIGEASEVSIGSVTPIESTAGVERVVTVSFPITPAYLRKIRQRIGSDITLLFPDDHVISTLPKADLATLLGQLGERGPAEEAEKSFLLATASSTGPSKTRVSPFRVNMSREGLLLLTMPMGDLLAAKRTIFFKGLLVTAIILSGTSLLFLSLIHRVTKPLEQLSNATRDIAGGNLDLQVRVSTRDEVGELATSFNVMVQRLKESRQEIEEWNRTLERRVEERTRSLQHAQKALEGVNDQLVQALSELRETQDQMIQTEKLAAVGQMASTMAHEIKNPLTGIRAALEVVVSELGVSAHAVVLEQVLEQVDRLARTSSRLLGFARRTTPQQVPSSLKELIENTRFLIGQQAKRAGVEIRLDLEPPDRPISLDPQLTIQAFLNITLNALQAMDGKGTLTIRSRWLAEQEAVSVAFMDTGRGMPPEVLEKVFTPFFTTKHQGTGLGLYVVKDIIERQGGEVTVASAPGEGTVVTVRLSGKPVSTAG